MNAFCLWNFQRICKVASIAEMAFLMRIVVGIFIVFQVFSGFSQDKFTDNLHLELTYQYGFTLPEYTFVSKVVNAPVQSIDIAIRKESTGSDAFEQLFKNPTKGLALYYTSLGNRDVLGRAVAVNYFFGVNFIQRSKFRLYNRMGIGLGYLSKVHSFEEPTIMNVAIGSHLNIHYNCRFGARFQIKDRFHADFGVSFDHFSNANTSEPNIGLNLLASYAGLSYRIGRFVELEKTVFDPHVKKWSFETFASIGGKHPRSFSGNYYLTASTSTQAVYEIFRGYHLEAGLDLFFDGSVKDQLEDTGQEFEQSKSFQSGIHFTQFIVYKKFRFGIQQGIYIGLMEPINGKKLYNRGILQYYVSDQISIRLAMKSHLHILDYPEIGVGIKWR